MSRKNKKQVQQNNNVNQSNQQYMPVRKSKFREKLDMYDMIIANLIAGNSIIEPTKKLDSSQIAIGFSNISSETQLDKYFMINKFPDYVPTQIIDEIRHRCMQMGVRINFYFEAKPHHIAWDSPAMVNRMTIWRRYTTQHDGSIDVFSYRTQRKESLARQRMILSTKYLNEMELDHKRSMFSTIFLIKVSGKRTEEGILNMAECIRMMKLTFSQMDIKLYEYHINMIDWIRAIGPFSLRSVKEVDNKLSRRVVTDDILANFNSYKQGHVGDYGVPVGIDVGNSGPVLHKFKADPDAAENWLISAETGGGKSFFIKVLMTFLLADGFTVCVMDYEGDEYDNLANYIKAGKPDDVKIVSMGKGSAVYFDPCEIPELTGDPEVDDELKDNAIEFILSMFRIIVHGLDGTFTREEEKIMSLAIQRMYDTAGVTDEQSTWKYSKGLKLADVYFEIKEMVESKELVDVEDDNNKHKAAIAMMDAASVYFEPGEAKSSTFKQPMSANDLYKAKFIVFSFGMKGLGESATDPIVLALKQLSVAYVNIRISNYCKYVKHCFNIKAWEEFQRYGKIKGSSETIINAITGGRKRGDVNFIITNNLGEILDDTIPLNRAIKSNIQYFAIGKIPDKSIRAQFCDKFDMNDIKLALDKIAKASASVQSGAQKINKSQNRYQNSFCIAFNDGKKAIVKARVPDVLLESKLFRTGVEVQEQEE